MTKTETTTSKTHDFVTSGCINQWHNDHDHADCWRALLRHNGLPESTTYPEFCEFLR